MNHLERTLLYGSHRTIQKGKKNKLFETIGFLYFIGIFFSAFAINFYGKFLLLVVLLAATMTKHISLTKGSLVSNILWSLYIFAVVLNFLVHKSITIDYLSPLVFFLVIPRFSQRLNVSRYNSRAATGVFSVVFYIFIVSAFWRLINLGFSLNLNNFYFLNKNTASMFFELIAGFLLLKNRSWFTYILSLLTLLLIGGKAALIFFFVYGLFTLCPLLLSRYFLYFISLMLSFLVIYLYSTIPYELIATLFYRLNIWNQAIFEIFNNWFFGNGINSFKYKVNEFGLLGKTAVHNYYLQVLHSYGIFGLALISLIISPLFKSRSPNTRLLLGMFMCHALVDVGWVYGPGLIYGIIIGLLDEKG